MPQMPTMTPAATAKLKEYLATWKTDVGSGETDMDFPTYLRTQYPDVYRTYLEMNGQGQQNQ
jgi:hypothetical protein